MKIKTSDLEGVALDWAVAKCEGKEIWLIPDKYFQGGKLAFTDEMDWDNDCALIAEYSTNWSQGGPIIEREEIEISVVGEAVQNWCAVKWPWDTPGKVGKTPLIAAMRCYVASKRGNEVDVPEELL